MNRFKDKYTTTTKKALLTSLNLNNLHQVPRVTKVIVNAGVGRAATDGKELDNAIATLAKITGQKPLTTYAKKSIAAFKVRQGMPIGAKVTLRGERMYDFLDRLINIVLPRIRDFRGLPIKAFDPQGNYSIGLMEQTIFPEIAYEDISSLHGLQVTIVTSAKDPESAKQLLTSLGFPFERSQ